MARLAAPVPNSSTHVPLLNLMAAVYALPRDPAVRFPRYLELVSAVGVPRFPPLMVMNPMARDHVSIVLLEIVSAGWERDAQDWLEEAVRMTGLQGTYRHGFGLADNLGGGWTAAADVEMKRRFAPIPAATADWLCTTLLVSQPVTATRLRAEVIATVARRVWQHTHGAPQSLRDHLAQEHAVAQHSGTQALSGMQIAGLTTLLRPFLDTTQYPIIVAALLGDAAAATLGYAGIGAPPNAGLMLAAHPDELFSAS